MATPDRPADDQDHGLPDLPDLEMAGQSQEEVADALDHEVASQIQGQGRRLAAAVALVFSILMHLAMGSFVFASGLIAPGWAVGLLIGVWIAGAIGIWRFRRSPVMVLVIPMAMAAIWWVTITLGDRYLGWTA
jgi:transcription elongation factor GreA-like protein